MTKTKEIAVALRARVLALTPAELALDDSPMVFGVVVEAAHPGAVATLVALADGSVSLYASDGRGCIGCGQHHEVRLSAADVLRAAALSLHLSSPSNDTSLPTDGCLRCFLLTPNGLRMLDTKLASIDAATHIGAIYFAAQRVVATIQRVEAGHSLGEEIELAQGGANRDMGEQPCLSAGNAARRLRI